MDLLESIEGMNGVRIISWNRWREWMESDGMENTDGIYGSTLTG